jgi:hypothetical protein
VVAAIALAVFFGGDNEHSDGTGEAGNTVGNIANGGIVAQSGDWVYYVNYDDGESLYRIRTDGTERTKLNDDWSTGINVVGDWVYYQNYDDDSLYRIRTGGTERTKLNDEPSSSINVVGDWVYYVNWDDDFSLYKIRTDGTERQQVDYDHFYND